MHRGAFCVKNMDELIKMMYNDDIDVSRKPVIELLFDTMRNDWLYKYMAEGQKNIGWLNL